MNLKTNKLQGGGEYLNLEDLLTNKRRLNNEYK